MFVEPVIYGRSRWCYLGVGHQKSPVPILWPERTYPGCQTNQGWWLNYFLMLLYFSELILHLVLFFSELLPFVTVVKGNTCNSNTITLITVHSTLFLVISWPLDDSVKGSNSCKSCINLDDKFPGFFSKHFSIWNYSIVGA